MTEVFLPLGLDDVREVRIVLAPDAGEDEATIATQGYLDNALRARGGDLLRDTEGSDGASTPLDAKPVTDAPGAR